MAVLILPSVQMVTRWIPEPELHGVDFEEEIPSFSYQSWYQFEFQPKLHAYLEDHYGFRPNMIRLFNQIDYSLFREPHGSGVIIGKQGYLYEHWFIDAHFGSNYIGDEIIETAITRLEAIRSHLLEHGTQLLVVVTPSKADFWPEYIPDRLKSEYATTNYEAITYHLWKRGFPMLDLNRWFIDMKDQTPAPLFPKTGTHWSHYGAFFSLDTLSSFIGRYLDRPMPRISLTQTTPVDSIVYPDHDLEQLMNLAFKLPRLKMAYPNIHFHQPDHYQLPRGVVISDSFFWELFNINLTGKLFEEVKFWYYFNSIYPDSYEDPVTVPELDLKQTLYEQDVIILMACPATIHQLGWGFIEKAFIELVAGITPDEWAKVHAKMMQEYMEAIRNTPEWFDHVVSKAQTRGIPVDSMMQIDAAYMVDQYILQGGL